MLSAAVPPRATLALLILLVALAACRPTRPEDVPPDEVFGTRIAEDAELLTIAPAPADTSVFVYPALVDEIIVRQGRPETPVDASEPVAVPVEILVKGALPDACSMLHAVTQERKGHLIDMELLTRRPQGTLCAQVVRPFRFYALLEGDYAPGSYTLRLNGGAHPFVVRRPRLPATN